MPLFFVFIQNTIISIIVLSAVVSTYALISNILSATCSNPEKSCYRDIFNKFAVTNKLIGGFDISPQSILILVMTILWIFLTQLFIHRARHTENKSDFNIQTPSDYAILLEFLPFNTLAEDIK